MQQHALTIDSFAHRIIATLLVLLASTASAGAQAGGAAAAALIAAFRDADAAAREAAFAALDGVVEPAEIDALLVERAAEAAAGIEKGSTLGQLERLAKVRTKVDVLRAQTLGIIFDKERYFSPYKVPKVSSEKAAAYVQVQREIDEKTRDLADLWGEKKKAKLSKGFRESLEDLAWTYALQTERAQPRTRRRRRRSQPAALAEAQTVALPDGLPDWILGVDPSLAKVTLRDFAWTAEERDSLSLGRAVMVYNELRMARALKAKRDLAEACRPTKAEAKQVAFTNEYRLMFGRSALAWDPRLQAATDHHSRYQSKWGILTHYEEKDQEQYDLGKRTKLAGYDRGRGENCSMGSPDPKGTHLAWCGSSGHHRNLLSEGHTEMASAVAGNYWTQNFGGRLVKIEELDAEAEWPAR